MVKPARIGGAGLTRTAALAFTHPASGAQVRDSGVMRAWSGARTDRVKPGRSEVEGEREREGRGGEMDGRGTFVNDDERRGQVEKRRVFFSLSLSHPTPHR
jgi:hypothetical protein